MISIARKNLSDAAHSFLSIHHFSTSKVRTSPTPCPKIFDVLFHKHHFSPEFASSIASSYSTSPERANSTLSFLKSHSFTTPQLEKIVRHNPRILGFTIEVLQSILQPFRDLGLSSEEIAKMMSSNESILHSSVKNSIIPKLSILKGLLGSNHDVVRLLGKSAWFLASNLDNTLMPTVEIVKSYGIPMERVVHFLHTRPRSFLVRPDIMRKSVDKAIEFGLPLTSTVFIQAVGVFNCMSQGMWEVKLQIFHDSGFSDDEILSIFRKQPSVFGLSEKQLKSAVELLLGTGWYSIPDIVCCPSSLMYSIEKRLQPRLEIVRLLESKNLIEKWPVLSRVVTPTDDVFLERFVSPYREEVGEAFDRMSYLSGKINEA